MYALINTAASGITNRSVLGVVNTTVPFLTAVGRVSYFDVVPTVNAMTGMGGKIYAIGRLTTRSDRNLYEVSKATGEFTKLGSLGSQLRNNVCNGLTSVGNQLYAAFKTGFYSVDTNGTATLISTQVPLLVPGRKLRG